MTFSPALSLGVVSLDEYVDIRLAREIDSSELETLVSRMNDACPAGLRFLGAALLRAEDPAISRVVVGARYIIAFARAAIDVPAGQRAEDVLAERVRVAMSATNLPIRRTIEGIGKSNAKFDRTKLLAFNTQHGERTPPRELVPAFRASTTKTTCVTSCARSASASRRRAGGRRR